MTDIKIGALCWNRYTEWPALLAAGVRAEELGYDTLWTWDQLPSSTGTERGDRTGHASTGNVLRPSALDGLATHARERCGGSSTNAVEWGSNSWPRSRAESG